jgi:hypothetical protein
MRAESLRVDGIYKPGGDVRRPIIPGAGMVTARLERRQAVSRSEP